MPKIHSVLSWSSHKAQWGCCQRCALASNRTKLVLAKGDVPCDVLFIGEAPGPSEDVLGIPFAGPAGQLLDFQISKAQELSGVQCRKAFTNLVGCIPAGDDKRKFTEPPKECIEACGPRLKEFIQLSQPKGVVALGLLAEKRIPAIWPLDAPFVKLVHPAAILRMGIEQRGLASQQAIILLSDFLTDLLGASNE